jgi:hypothetical protein
LKIIFEPNLKENFEEKKFVNFSKLFEQKNWISLVKKIGGGG